jgi:3-oxoacyl-[acyl-carrier-protein] synthase I
MPAVITASNVLCAGGRGTEQLWATVRAGISCIKTSPLVDRHVEPIQMGLVPDSALKPLPPELQSLGLPAWVRRMLQLAAPTLAATSDFAGALPLIVYLGLPHVTPEENPWLAHFLEYLSICAAVPIDVDKSQIFPMGRAASLLAMENALESLSQNPKSRIVVGGVDSFLDLNRIGILDRERRILSAMVLDGFIPGEGAGFLVLNGAAVEAEANAGAAVFVHGAATVIDPGHRYGSEPALGEGLAQALDKLRSAPAVPNIPVSSTFAGFNGESFEAKLWGVARLRHTDFFTPGMVLQHPADCVGDMGAATGAILAAVASFALAECQREGPSLIWAASDHELRGCSLLSK